MNEGPRLAISPGLRQILDYPRFQGPTRMLVLETQYFFDQSWIRAAKRLGWQAETVPSAMTGGITRDAIETLFRIICTLKPDFILASNYSGMDVAGIFAHFFEDARIPYVSWFTDTPRMILFNRYVHSSPYHIAATWEQGYLPHLKALGFDNVFYMPLATDPDLFQGEPAAVHERQVSFVGTSMVEQIEEGWAKLAHKPDVIQAIRAAMDEGRVTREQFAEGIEHCLDVLTLADLDASERRNVELCLVYEATRREREALVRRMLPFDIEVRGDADWLRVTPKAKGTVGYFDALSGYYRSTAINLNTTSLQMKSAVNQRVFDCPAAGGFLLTDAQADMNTLFEPETETAVYHSLDELEDKTRFYLAHPEVRREIIIKAQRRINAHHTHAHRLQALETYLKGLFGA